MTDYGVDPAAGFLSSASWSMARPSAVVHQRLQHVFDEHHGVAPQRRRAVAAESAVRTALLVRSDEPRDSVIDQIFTSELGDISLRVDGDTVAGTVIPLIRPTPGAFAVAMRDQPHVRSYAGDNDGGFSLGDLPAGRHWLVVDNTHLEIEFEVNIGGAEA